MTAQVLSTNIARPHTCPSEPERQTGIHKVATEKLTLTTPGPNYGDGSGVVGDFVGDTKHHGGAHKAVYAFAREELDYWQGEIGIELPSGYFGENLTTGGIIWADAVVGTVFTVGSARLQVSVPRTPCRTFGDWLEVRGWSKRVTGRGDLGSYLRVLEEGAIAPGDFLKIESVPDHGVTMGEAFAAKMGNKAAAAQVVRHRVLPEHDLVKLRKLL